MGMIRRITLWALLSLLLPEVAIANVTINNFDGLGTALFDQVTYYDQNGDGVDAHSGKIIQIGSTFYRYGDKYGCGFRYGASGAYCGANLYTSTDLINWSIQAQPFALDSTILTQCDASIGGTSGCFWPRMILNPSGTWVHWVFNAGTTNGFMVFTCGTGSTPGTCTRQTDPSHLAVTPGTNVGPGDIMVDGSNCYITYTDTRATGGYSGHHIVVEQLNSTCTDSNGGGQTFVSAIADGLIEAPTLFKEGSTYHVIAGPTCAYCTSTATYDYHATSPTGTWSAHTQINATSCGGQPASVSKLTISASPVYLYQSDLYRGIDNESMANTFMQALTFTGPVADAFTCDAQVTITGLTPNPPPETRLIDQTDETASVFTNWCDITSTKYDMQIVVPAVNTSSFAVYLGLLQGTGGTSFGGSAPNGDLQVLLRNIDGSNNPTTTLATVNVPASSLSWNIKPKLIDFGVAGTSGTHYGIELKGLNSTGCYGYSFSMGSPVPYSAGLERYSTDGGSTWTTLTDRAERFATRGNATFVTVPFGGVAH